MESLLAIISDTVARVLLSPSEVPVGIAIAVIGAPYYGNCYVR